MPIDVQDVQERLKNNEMRILPALQKILDDDTVSESKIIIAVATQRYIST